MAKIDVPADQNSIEILLKNVGLSPVFDGDEPYSEESPFALYVPCNPTESAGQAILNCIFQDMGFINFNRIVPAITYSVHFYHNHSAGEARLHIIYSITYDQQRDGEIKTTQINGNITLHDLSNGIEYPGQVIEFKS